MTFSPSAAFTIKRFLDDTNTKADNYDAIITGDLGKIGSELLYKLLKREDVDIALNHNDCGLLIFDREQQDVHAGGSGCGCSAAVLNSFVMHQFERGAFRNILFISTGALMSPTSSLQGESILGISHLVNIKI